MRSSFAVVVSLLHLAGSAVAYSQVVFAGRVWVPRVPEAARSLPPNTGIIPDYFASDRTPDSPDLFALSNVRVFASRVGPGKESIAFRTWELAPTGWYRMSGGAGNYTLVFTGPSIFVRPTVFTNQFTRPGDKVDRQVAPQFDYAVIHDGAWDDKAATDYYQTFVARGKSVTQVGFRLVHDGVDGIGPGTQTLLVSIHKKGDGTPEKWPQVGPAMSVPDVDAGGPKMYDWTAAWNSGEVPLTPGETYAVHLRAEKPGGTFQMFWRPDEDRTADCYRLGTQGETGYRGRDLWMVVGTDGDGLLIPYNKRIQKEYKEFAGGSTKWSQTYVAQGRSLAFAGLYAAVGTAHPGLHRQRAVVRVRAGGPDGAVVGTEKIAIGNGNYTGDASWGMYGVAFAPGEVPLEPGKTYAIEFESIENYESLHGYVNIKGVVCDEKPGFNPYRKTPPDTYEKGTAYKGGKEDVGFDLDMQIVEYEHAASDWEWKTDAANLLANGDMEAGTQPADVGGKGSIEHWTPFATDSETGHAWWADGPKKDNRIARVFGGGPNGKTVDGGWVQRVAGLNHMDTYRLSGRVRSSYAASDECTLYVGFDPTGQTDDPKAATITWTPLPDLHSVWTAYVSDPIRPARDAVSVWLRGYAKSKTDMQYRADFDDFALRRVCTGVPGR